MSVNFSSYMLRVISFQREGLLSPCASNRKQPGTGWEASDFLMMYFITRLGR